MQTTLLSPDQTETADANVLCDTFPGTYQLICVKYADSPVRLQVKEAGGTQWQDANFAGNAITLCERGASLELPTIPCYQYRCITETAGAEVVAIADTQI